MRFSKYLSDWKIKHPGCIPEWTKGGVRLYLRSTARWRALPDFIVLGTPKSGTTSFYAYLSQHQKVITSFEKEPSYLRDSRFGSFQGYRSCFPLQSTLKASGCLTGEGTTTYFYDAVVAERIVQLPEFPKLFLVVRDPTDRAISQYYHFQRQGRERRDIEEVFDYLLERYEGWEVGKELPSWDLSQTASDYLKYGIYAHFFPIWQKYYEAGSLKIYEFDQLTSRPEWVMEEAFGFLGLEPAVVKWDVFNKGSSRQKHDELRKRLAEFYAPFNERFMALSGCGGAWS